MMRIRLWRRRQAGTLAPQDQFNGLTEAEFHQLARYNAERQHGIVHTPEWEAAVAALQARWDEGEKARRWQA